MMQDQERAKIVGSRSAGNTEIVYPHNFSDGSRLWLAQEGFKLPNGTSIEGRGVIPNAEIDLNWADYTERDDPHILKAIELLKKGGK
jgi:C-terminal processing protease CtpA/Prc